MFCSGESGFRHKRRTNPFGQMLFLSERPIKKKKKKTFAVYDEYAQLCTFDSAQPHLKHLNLPYSCLQCRYLLPNHRKSTSQFFQKQYLVLRLVLHRLSGTYDSIPVSILSIVRTPACSADTCDRIAGNRHRKSTRPRATRGVHQLSIWSREGASLDLHTLHSLEKGKLHKGSNGSISNFVILILTP